MKKPDGKVVLLGDMNVGKTSLLHRYMERRFQETVSTVGGAFYLKQWGPYNISIWDTAGREQFHGLGSMYCRGAAAVILTYDVNSLQSLTELEERFLALTDSASADCIFAIVGNKVDLSDDCTSAPDENRPGKSGASCGSKVRKQVRAEDAIALYKKILKYKMLDEKDVPAAEKMCFETSAKTGYKVDYLFETVFDMVVPIIVRQKAEGPPQTVDITDYKPAKRTKSGCCA
ncbi:ras-related protein Rab-20 [Ammospiza nelsoni]|uniref:Ras-related protein Rab-20 n=1 Tax=Junco hyemalis TaxID=40217 RepID=A0A8C5IPD7_JUNHY|nr:ras-related protein Rab-20 [Melozone crissalis]XP_057874292.1 ras-related protein Rab-20 [Melospiza georgiana]XP_058655914.1 ras-related protein Rab-20 [Ammospiza caudacuta]XP_059322955.1 ras-related protein Rab-20 [Ammospiza nelsoni]